MIGNIVCWLAGRIVIIALLGGLMYAITLTVRLLGNI